MPLIPSSEKVFSGKTWFPTLSLFRRFVKRQSARSFCALCQKNKMTCLSPTVVSGVTGASPDFRCWGLLRSHQLGVYSDHSVPGLSKLAETIRAGGAEAILQICHAGRQSSKAVLGRQPVAPSAVPNFGEMPIRCEVNPAAGREDGFRVIKGSCPCGGCNRRLQ